MAVLVAVGSSSVEVAAGPFTESGVEVAVVVSASGRVDTVSAVVVSLGASSTSGVGVGSGVGVSMISARAGTGVGGRPGTSSVGVGTGDEGAGGDVSPQPAARSLTLGVCPRNNVLSDMRH